MLSSKYCMFVAPLLRDVVLAGQPVGQVVLSVADLVVRTPSKPIVKALQKHCLCEDIFSELLSSETTSFGMRWCCSARVINSLPYMCQLGFACGMSMETYQVYLVNSIHNRCFYFSTM